MTQHVAHRHSDEIAQLHAEIERLRAAIITQGAEIDRICEFSLADRAEIERLRAVIMEQRNVAAGQDNKIADMEIEIERLRSTLRQPCDDAEFGMKP